MKQLVVIIIRVLAVLVSYFNQGKKDIVFEHLILINVSAVTTENILNTLINLFKKNQYLGKVSLQL